MGGDFGPRVTVPAIMQALSFYPDLTILLTGHSSDLSSELSHYPLSTQYLADERLVIVHAERVIAANEKPSFAMRHGRDTSMGMALDQVAKHKADACVSAGNTGALMALAKYKLKMLDGIKRPALISALPAQNGQLTWLLDLGANVSSDADNLFEFAIMGATLAEISLKRPAKVALLNVGSEEIKGNDVIKRCAQMLLQLKTLNYVGYVEGNQLFTNDADVIVCDGFVGNVCLKACEGTASLFIDKLKQFIKNSRLSGWLLKIIFPKLFQQIQCLNPEHHNGAILLGLRAVVIKSHGNADKDAFVSAIGEAVHEVQRKIPHRISKRMEAVQLERH